MKIIKTITLIAMALIIGFAGCERKTETITEVIKEISPTDAAYIGSKQCATCHDAIFTSFMKTGHPFKLNEADSVQMPGYYPFTTIASPPAGVSWSEVDKVIGGFRW